MASQVFERKLTAILSADAADYSRLMVEDDEATVHTLSDGVKSTLDSFEYSNMSQE